ncbi:hypothetical protein VK70_10365 [Paenibacillus durus ATCC 35681]|uniref:Uncharacterized protein n=1 Tax=Paenibacillus durus ATCC 35681 TaxID=1333534 RepID=A0A0F7F9V5_PAEDU|nr:hypothetical protein VK70_10365 [Paenibacillus durus ATCC 35681]
MPDHIHMLVSIPLKMIVIHRRAGGEGRQIRLFSLLMAEQAVFPANLQVLPMNFAWEEAKAANVQPFSVCVAATGR